MLSQITPVILTFNEENNIGRTLEQLRWANEVLVVDSFSTDATVDICAGFSNVRVVQHAFDSHAQQWNFAIHECQVSTPWVLALDADYVLSNALIDEMATTAPLPDMQGYWLRFRYCVFGQPLRGSLYPPVLALYKREAANYRQDGHTQRVEVPGYSGELQATIDHDDRKPLGRWLAAQEKYAELECAVLTQRHWRELRWPDRLRKLLFITPWLVPLYCLTIKLCILDGHRGLYYSLQRGLAETLLTLKLLEQHFTSSRRE